MIWIIEHAASMNQEWDTFPLFCLSLHFTSVWRLGAKRILSLKNKMKRKQHVAPSFSLLSLSKESYINVSIFMCCSMARCSLCSLLLFVLYNMYLITYLQVTTLATMSICHSSEEAIQTPNAIFWSRIPTGWLEDFILFLSALFYFISFYLQEIPYPCLINYKVK